MKMAKQTGLFLLLSIYTALLITCGIEYRIGFAVAAAATATSVNTNTHRAATATANTATCGAGPDQPQCDDPSLELKEPAPSPSPSDVEIRGSRRSDPSKDRAYCTTGGDCDSSTSTSLSRRKQRSNSSSGESASKFQSGDIIELYNTQSRDIQIVFPSIVKGRDLTNPTGGHRYTVTKTTDGKEVKDISEKFLHMYVPYQEGDEALCNIGEFKPQRPIIVRCTVLGYEPAASRGALVLQGNYSVQVHATKANEEYLAELPVWKLQRRYQATKATATA